MRRSFLVPVVASIVFAACDPADTPTASPDDLGIIAQINDGANGGNAHFFFLTPFLPNDPKQFNGELNAGLQPTVSICEYAERGAPCAADGTGASRVFGPFEADLDGEHYAFSWQTVDFALSADKFYRVSVFVGKTEVGFADVDVVEDQNEKRRVERQFPDFVAIIIDRTWPIKFRIEDGAICEALAPGSFDAGTCIEGGVNLDGESEVSFSDGSGVFIPDQGVSLQTTMAVLTCAAAGKLPLDLVTVGPCISVQTADEVAITDPNLLPTITLCVTLDDLIAANLTHEQIELLKVHRLNGNGTLRALPEDEDRCAEPLIIPEDVASLSPNRTIRRAQLAWRSLTNRVSALLGAEPLYASMYIDGRGRSAVEPPPLFGVTANGAVGEGEPQLFSEYQFALPATIQKVPETDGQTAPVGSAVANPPAVLVLDAEGEPVQGAAVRFGHPNVDGTVDPQFDPGAGGPVVLSDANGIAQANSWVIANADLNILDAGGRGYGLAPNPPFLPNEVLGLPSSPLPIDPAATVTFEAFGVIQIVFRREPGNARVGETIEGVLVCTDPGAVAGRSIFIEAFNNNGEPAELVPVNGTTNPGVTGDDGCAVFDFFLTKTGAYRLLATDLGSGMTAEAGKFNIRPAN